MLDAAQSHLGMMGGGHYIACGLNPNGKWYLYNDSACKEVRSVDLHSLCTSSVADLLLLFQIPEDEVKKESAYLLFYQARGLGMAL